MKKKVIGMVLAALLAVLGFPMAAFGVSGADMCNVTFNVTDETGRYDGALIVGFTNAETNQEDITPLALEYANSYGVGNPLTVSIPRNKTYNLEFIFPPIDTAKDLIVLSSDGSPAPTIIATERNELGIELKITKASISNAPTPAANDAPGITPSGIGAFDPDRIESANEEGNAVFTKFIETMRGTFEDPAWAGFYINYETMLAADAPLYEKYTGRPAQEYMDMTTFERFLIMETYLRLYGHAMAGSNDYYFGSEEKFRAHAVQSGFGFLNNVYYENKKVDTTKEQEAFWEVALFEYNFIKENGLPYNYLTGVADPSAVGEKEQESGIDVQLPNVEEENLTDDGSLGIVPEDTSTLGMIKGSASAIIVAVIAAVALAIYMLWKRRKNISEREEA